ncbi:hypothetical protein GGR57DRAFT_479534 [Xylariaceae sp. FL1272]|nr:hypothetical protein GGR57DRAFT_479534 [Xylariaceae sp. FL1272]
MPGAQGTRRKYLHAHLLTPVQPSEHRLSIRRYLLTNGYYTCRCGTTIKYGKVNYDNHFRRTHPEAPSNGYTESKKAITHTCDECSRTYKNHHSLREHKRKKHSHRGDSTMLKNFTPVKGRAYDPNKPAKKGNKKRAAPDSDSDDADEDEVDSGAEWDPILDDGDDEPGAGGHGHGHGHDGGVGGAQAVQVSA